MHRVRHLNSPQIWSSCYAFSVFSVGLTGPWVSVHPVIHGLKLAKPWHVTATDVDVLSVVPTYFWFNWSLKDFLCSTNRLSGQYLGLCTNSSIYLTSTVLEHWPMQLLLLLSTVGSTGLHASVQPVFKPSSHVSWHNMSIAQTLVGGRFQWILPPTFLRIS